MRKPTRPEKKYSTENLHKKCNEHGDHWQVKGEDRHHLYCNVCNEKSIVGELFANLAGAFVKKITPAAAEPDNLTSHNNSALHIGNARKQTMAALEGARRMQSNDLGAGVVAARVGARDAVADGIQSAFVEYAGQLAVAPAQSMLRVITAVLLLTRLGIPIAVQEILGSVSSLALLADVARVGLGSRKTISRYQVYCSFIVREKIANLVGTTHWYSLVVDEATPKFGDAKTMVAISCYCPSVARHPILLDAFPILRTDLDSVNAKRLADIVADTIAAYRFKLERCTMLITDNAKTMEVLARVLGVRHIRCHGHVFSLAANALVDGEVMKSAQRLLTAITGYIGHSNAKKASFEAACGISIKDLSTAGTRWCTVLDALCVVTVSSWTSSNKFWPRATKAMSPVVQCSTGQKGSCVNTKPREPTIMRLTCVATLPLL